jgi:hypothetical protein
MRPREPHVVERAVLTSVVLERDPRDPRRHLGQVDVLDLDSGERRTTSFSWATTWTVLERLKELRDLVLPTEPGRPPPTVRVHLEVEPDRSPTFVRAERVEPEPDDLDAAVRRRYARREYVEAAAAWAVVDPDGEE